LTKKETEKAKLSQGLSICELRSDESRRKLHACEQACETAYDEEVKNAEYCAVTIDFVAV